MPIEHCMLQNMQGVTVCMTVKQPVDTSLAVPLAATKAPAMMSSYVY